MDRKLWRQVCTVNRTEGSLKWSSMYFDSRTGSRRSGRHGASPLKSHRIPGETMVGWCCSPPHNHKRRLHQLQVTMGPVPERRWAEARVHAILGPLCHIGDYSR